jgi:hypothetical protein
LISGAGNDVKVDHHGITSVVTTGITGRIGQIGFDELQLVDSVPLTHCRWRVCEQVIFRLSHETAHNKQEAHVSQQTGGSYSQLVEHQSHPLVLLSSHCSDKLAIQSPHTHHVNVTFSHDIEQKLQLDQYHGIHVD